MYMDLLTKYKKEHQFRLFAYCLLPDRLHLLVEPMQAAGISQIMHDINSRFTKHSNGRYDRRGPLFESRFKSVLVDKQNLLSAVTRWVHRAAGDQYKEHPYSSYGLHAEGKAGSVPMSEEASAVKNDLNEKKLPDYASYCADGAAAAELEKRLSRGGVVGSDEFVESVRAKIQQHAEEIKVASAPVQPPSVVARVAAALLIASALAAAAYLYVAKQSLEKKYAQLLESKEIEFIEKTSFEHRSPIALASLEGTVWTVEAVSSAGADVFRDSLRFEKGLLASAHFGSKGFAPAEFNLAASNGSAAETWSATQRSANGETLTWRGVWRGDALKGEAVLTGPAGMKQAFTFFSVRGEYLPETR